MKTERVLCERVLLIFYVKVTTTSPTSRSFSSLQVKSPTFVLTRVATSVTPTPATASSTRAHTMWTSPITVRWWAA